jgi:cell division protein ZapA
MQPLLNEKLRVRIYGRDYELDPGGLTPLEANRVASYVDLKMKEISDKFNIVDTQKIAVLAALNIALELSQQQTSSARVLSLDDEQSVLGMIATLDKSLK